MKLTKKPQKSLEKTVKKKEKNNNKILKKLTKQLKKLPKNYLKKNKKRKKFSLTVLAIFFIISPEICLRQNCQKKL